MNGLLEYLPWLFWPALLGVIFLAMYLCWLEERRRGEAMRAVARELGFEWTAGDNSRGAIRTALRAAAREVGFYQPTDDPVLQTWLDRFHLFSWHTTKFTHVMRGKTADLDVAIFDWTYTTRRLGRSIHALQTSVICLRAADLNLPEFFLQTRSFWHRFEMGEFGWQSIDFRSHPRFSSEFLLMGPNEEAVRDVFTSEVLEHFEKVPELCTEGNGDTLVIYRRASRFEPEKVRGYLEEAFAILPLFRRV
jgi:hypothetical protein